MVAPSVAPGPLEQVRTFLNTWRLPHDTRTAEDRLKDLIDDEQAWRDAFPHIPFGGEDLLDELTELRIVLRRELGTAHPTGLAEWLRLHPVTANIGDEQPISYTASDPGPVGALLELVVTAVGDRVWSRMKACPDCRYVFYDHSRNRTRTWCGMYAETSNGRACGSIAKVRAHRQRQRQATRDTSWLADEQT